MRAWLPRHDARVRRRAGDVGGDPGFEIPRAVRAALDATIAKLGEIGNILARDPADPAILEFLTQAKARRDTLRLPPSPNV